MTEKAKRNFLVGSSSIIVVILFLVGLLWNQNYDYVKRVDAKCIDLYEKKADKDTMDDVKARLVRIEDKIDKINERRY